MCAKTRILLGLSTLALLTSSCGGSDSRHAGAASAPAGESASITEIVADPDAYSRTRRLATLLPTLGPEAIDEVKSLIDNRLVDESEVGADATLLLARYWATYQPAEASEWALFRSTPGYRTAVVTIAVRLWARQDPIAAAQRVIRITALPGPGLQAAQVELVRGWLDSGEPGLEDYIRDLGMSDDRQRALRVYARERTARDGPEPVMEWAESLPDQPERFKLAAYRQVATALAGLDPALGVEWCRRHCEGPFGSNIRKLVAIEWAKRDGAATMRWLADAPAGTDRTLAVRDAFVRWQMQDPGELYAWIEETSSDGVPEFLNAIGINYALKLAGRDPERAIEWAMLEPEPERRALGLMTVARRWLKDDPEAAEAWLAQSPLSEEERQKARRPPRFRPPTPGVPLEPPPPLVASPESGAAS